MNPGTSSLDKARKKKKFRRRRAFLQNALTFWRRRAPGAASPGGVFRSETGTETGASEEGRTSGEGGSGFLPGSVKLGVVALCALLSLLVAFDGWQNAGEVYSGVAVGGVNVGGESREGAERVLVSGAADLPERVTFSAGERSVTLDRRELGLRLDARKSASRAFAVGRQGGFTPRIEGRLASSFASSEVRPEISYRKTALRRAFKVKPVEAGYQPTDDPNLPVGITPSREGVRISDPFWRDLEARIMAGDRNIEVPLETVTPKLETAEAEELAPTDMLSSFSTNYLTYDDTAGRTTNLQIASEAVNGTLVAPGEVFSFNELAEPLDYEASKVIIRGRVDEADGGGLCQVSSTLYVAANLAGLGIVERHPHMAELPYIRPGLDATVWFGALDMKFRNTSPGYLYLQQWVDTTTGNVNAAIYGIPTGTTGTMDSERTARYRDADKNTVTEWVTYRTISRNGEVIESGPIHTDTYTSLEKE